MKKVNLKGLLLLDISGPGAERFINICRHHNIYFKNIRCDKNSFKVEINATDFLKLKEYIKATKIKIRILRKEGLPFWYKKQKKRYAFLVGIGMFIFFILFLSRFIWNIEINGNMYYSEETLLEFLYTEGIYSGAIAGNVNEEELETQIRRNFDGIIWVSVSVNGTKLTIDVKENDTNPLAEKQEEPRDIVASKDGVVKSVLVRSGTAIVKPGDEVKAGDILVTSKVACTNESAEEVKVVYVVADADIVIETVSEYKDEIQRNYQLKEYTGNVMEQQLMRIGDKFLESTIGKCDFKLYDVVVDYANPGKNALVYGYRYYREYVLVDKNYSNKELNELLQENLVNYISKLQENSIQIIENSVKIDVNGLKGTASGTIRAYEPAITYATPIITEEITDETEGTKTE